MATYLSGGGRTYVLDLEIVKSTPASSWTSQTTSSPSSTISESSNSPRGISTRKPRTPRKRPNQTYNEAAALLSTAYPNLFSTQNITKPWKSTKPWDFFPHESPELLLPFRVVDDDGCLIQTRPEKPESTIVSKGRFLPGSGEVDSAGSSDGLGAEPPEDFDAGSILDEEIEEGIDSIMGDSTVDGGSGDTGEIQTRPIFSGNYPLGLGFGANSGFGLGLRRGVRAMRGVDEANWWNFLTIVDVAQLTTKTEKKKKKKKVEKIAVVAAKEAAAAATKAEAPVTNNKPDNNKLLLKLDYDGVLNAWSDGSSPFTDAAADAPGIDVSARLAQIDLLWDGGGPREASVLRYKEKRRSRLFSKKIRYQVRKVNADQRPRKKGRFVRRSRSSSITSNDGS